MGRGGLRIGIVGAGIGGLAATELEDLPGDGRGLEAGAVDFLQHLVHLRLAGDLGREDLAAAVDDGKQVVEIVRHAAGEQAHGVELLRMQQGLALAPVFG